MLGLSGLLAALVLSQGCSAGAHELQAQSEGAQASSCSYEALASEYSACTDTEAEPLDPTCEESEAALKDASATCKAERLGIYAGANELPAETCQVVAKQVNVRRRPGDTSCGFSLPFTALPQGTVVKETEHTRGGDPFAACQAHDETDLWAHVTFGEEGQTEHGFIFRPWLACASDAPSGNKSFSQPVGEDVETLLQQTVPAADLRTALDERFNHYPPACARGNTDNFFTCAVEVLEDLEATLNRQLTLEELLTVVYASEFGPIYRWDIPDSAYDAVAEAYGRNFFYLVKSGIPNEELARNSSLRLHPGGLLLWLGTRQGFYYQWSNGNGMRDREAHLGILALSRDNKFFEHTRRSIGLGDAEWQEDGCSAGTAPCEWANWAAGTHGYYELRDGWIAGATPQQVPFVYDDCRSIFAVVSKSQDRFLPPPTIPASGTPCANLIAPAPSS